MTKWVTGKVVQVKHWTNRLFSLIIRAPVNSFIPGQFTKLALEINGVRVQRAYSYVNAPKDVNLEFYLVTIPKGKLSQSLYVLQPEAPVLINKEASGFFILKEIPNCENLWMIATGTAIGPYLSILEQGDGLERFKNIVLVHATRFANELSYLTKMSQLQNRYSGKLQVITVVSRERSTGSLTGRVPMLITDGSLEAAVNIQLNAENSHIMLCGNPEMVSSTQQLLINNHGMRKHLKRLPGHITTEQYW